MVTAKEDYRTTWWSEGGCLLVAERFAVVLVFVSHTLLQTCRYFSGIWKIEFALLVPAWWKWILTDNEFSCDAYRLTRSLLLPHFRMVCILNLPINGLLYWNTPTILFHQHFCKILRNIYQACVFFISNKYAIIVKKNGGGGFLSQHIPDFSKAYKQKKMFEKTIIWWLSKNYYFRKKNTKTKCGVGQRGVKAWQYFKSILWYPIPGTYGVVLGRFFPRNNVKHLNEPPIRFVRAERPGQGFVMPTPQPQWNTLTFHPTENDPRGDLLSCMATTTSTSAIRKNRKLTEIKAAQFINFN